MNDTLLNKITTIVSIVTAALSVIVAGVTVYFSNSYSQTQIDIQEEYNKLSVIPKIKSLAVLDSDAEFSGIGIKNCGLGPAIISNTFYSIDGRWLEAPAYEALVMGLSEITQKKDNDNFFINPLNDGNILKEGEEFWFIKTKNNSKMESKVLLEYLKRTGISICYYSLYQERYNKKIGRVPNTEKICKQN